MVHHFVYSQNMNMLEFLLIFMIPDIAYSANILVASSLPYYSHEQVFLTVAKELSLTGHNVTLITTNNHSDVTENYTKIDISHTKENFYKQGGLSSFHYEQSVWKTIVNRKLVQEIIATSIFETEEIRKLLSDGRNYDLVIVEPHIPVYFAFGFKFKAPIIGKCLNDSFYRKVWRMCVIRSKDAVSISRYIVKINDMNV